jgi:hypothetical protein
MLITTATEPHGQGPPATLEILHSAQSIDFDRGEVVFENGKRVIADLIIGADGVVVSISNSSLSIMRTGTDDSMAGRPSSPRRDHSWTSNRQSLPPLQHVTAATSTSTNSKPSAWRNTPSESSFPIPFSSLTLTISSSPYSPAIQFWGGFETPNVNKYTEIVMAPCSGGNLISFYCFFPVSCSFYPCHKSLPNTSKSIIHPRSIVRTLHHLETRCQCILHPPLFPPPPLRSTRPRMPPHAIQQYRSKTMEVVRTYSATRLG